MFCDLTKSLSTSWILTSSATSTSTPMTASTHESQPAPKQGDFRFPSRKYVRSHNGIPICSLSQQSPDPWSPNQRIDPGLSPRSVSPPASSSSPAPAPDVPLPSSSSKLRSQCITAGMGKGKKLSHAGHALPCNYCAGYCALLCLTFITILNTTYFISNVVLDISWVTTHF